MNLAFWHFTQLLTYKFTLPENVIKEVDFAYSTYNLYKILQRIRTSRVQGQIHHTTTFKASHPSLRLSR